VKDRLNERSSAPPGATPSANGVNFNVFSRHATSVLLLLLDGVDDTRAAQVVQLDPAAAA
jgi:isoamylase